MKIKPSDYKSILFFSLLAVLVGCSPSQKTSEEKNQTADTQTDQPSESETLLAADGWRKGKLRIEVNIDQSGGQKESVLNSQWASTIKAVSEEQVMLAPDLRPFVSSGPINSEDMTQYDPFRASGSDTNTMVSSEAKHTATWIVETDKGSVNNQGSFEGKVDYITLQLHPSLFGPGYEAHVSINLAGKTKIKETINSPQQGSHTTDNDKDDKQEIKLDLYPVPNKEKLNDYQYIPTAMDEDLKQRVIQQNMEMLSYLNQSYADTLPVQHEILAGMKSEATEDKLTLTFEYTGDKQVAYATILGVSAGLANNNKVSIKIVLSADK